MYTANRHPRSLVSRRSRAITLTLLLAMVLLLPAFALASSPAPATAGGDLGDAPDSTNHFGVGMQAYPFAALLARYPTVFDPATGLPEGPLHANPTGNGWLGAGVTMETDADMLPDADGVRNIDPPANTRNRDARDDGVPPVNPNGIPLPQCQMTRFQYIVTGAGVVPVPTNYVNVWIDFNRDGDWEDIFTCTTSTGSVLTVSEWAVRDQVVNVVPGSANWITSPIASFNPGGHRDVWMRINIAEIRAPLNPATGRADGRGPANTYRYGETEDYYLRYSGSGIVYNPL